jgi:hypothetical protein
MDKAPGQLFISYGRADAKEFVSRLKADLEKDGNYKVWLDLACGIEAGSAWDVELEEGIRDSTVVGAVVTPHSVRQDSFCRKEIVFALMNNKKLVPLRCDKNAQLTLLLCNLQWIDFADSYEQGLADLRRYLEGDASVLRPPRLPTITGAVPLDFSVEIARFAADFTGRAWLSDALERWLADSRGRVLVISGEPGVGKSAIAAWLAKERSDVVAVHFCSQRNTRSLNPQEFVAALVQQLHAEVPGFAEHVEKLAPAIRRPTASDAFRELVVEPARQLGVPERPRLIIVDALDEAALQTGETIIDVLTKQGLDLPPWLRIVATTRPESQILEQLQALSLFQLQADQPDNRRDLSGYIAMRLKRPRLAERLGADTAKVQKALEELAQGNFLYASLALDALEEGLLLATELDRVSPGLAAFYGLQFRKRYADVAHYGRAYEPFLTALVAAEAPLPFTVLQKVAKEDARSVNTHLRDLRAYLRASGAGAAAGYELFHKSLRDWLGDRDGAGDYWCDAHKGQNALAQALLADWRGDDYAARHLPAHLAQTGRWDDLANLLCELPFVEARTAAGRVFDLVKDFSDALTHMAASHPRRHIVEVLHRALRRDIHFIARHPQALFQCLWNQCWWYDCPEAAAHYGRPKGGWRGEGPPWKRPGPKLYALMESWRAAKNRDSPSFAWLRSLLPPPSLETSKEAIFRGHAGSVESVALCPRWPAACLGRFGRNAASMGC